MNTDLHSLYENKNVIYLEEKVVDLFRVTGCDRCSLMVGLISLCGSVTHCKCLAWMISALKAVSKPPHSHICVHFAGPGQGICGVCDSTQPSAPQVSQEGIRLHSYGCR